MSLAQVVDKHSKVADMIKLAPPAPVKTALQIFQQKIKNVANEIVYEKKNVKDLK